MVLAVLEQNKVDDIYKSEFFQRKLEILLSQLKTQKDRNAFQKLKQKGQKRIYYFQELVSKEEKYIKDLESIITQLKVPVETDNLLSKQEINTVFSNIQSILSFNKTFYERLTNIEKTSVNPYYIKISENILGEIPNFQIYIDYLKTITQNQLNNTFFQIVQDRQQFRTFILNYIEKNVKYKPLTLKEKTTDLEQTLYDCIVDPQLKRPYNRLFNYRLTFNEIQQNMQEDHIDYRGMEEVIVQFHTVTQELDEIIRTSESNEKIKELQLQYGSDQLNLLDNKTQSRKFLFLQKTNYLKRENNIINIQVQQERVSQAFLYFLNDLLLIVERNEGDGDDEVPGSYLDHVFLDQYSSVKDLDNTKHLRFLVGFSGKSMAVTFVSDTSYEKKLLMDRISKLANSYRAQNFEGGALDDLILIDVKTLGSRENNTNSLSQETEYILEFQSGDWFTQSIFITYEKFKAFDNKVKSKFPNIKLDIGKSKILDEFKTYVIEDRKMLMENYFQILFQTEQFITSPHLSEYLELLSLPENLIQILKDQKSHQQTNNQSASIFEWDQSIDPISPERAFKGKISFMHDTSPPTDLLETNGGNSSRLSPTSNRLSPSRRPLDPQEKKGMQQINRLKSVSMARLNLSLDSKSSPLRISKLMSKSSIHNPRSCVEQVFLQSPWLRQKEEMIIIFNRNSIPMQIPYFVTVYCSDGQSYNLNYSKRTTAFEMCNQLAEIINLQFFFDFRLFMVINDQSEEVLHDDVIIYNKIPRIEKTSFLEKIGVQQKLQISLRFQKYFWLTPQVEERSIVKDLVRLDLIHHQLVNDMNRFYITFTDFQSYYYITVLHMMVIDQQFLDKLCSVDSTTEIHTIESLNEILYDQSQSIMPNEIFKLIPRDQFIENFKIALENIKQWYEQDRQRFTTVKINVDPSDRDILNDIVNNIDSDDIPNTQKSEIHQKIIENKSNFAEKFFVKRFLFHIMTNNVQFGYRHYYVHTHKHTVKSMVEKKNIKLPDNVFISVSIKGINLLGPISQQFFFCIKFDDIKYITVQPRGIIFTLDEDEKLILKFETYYGFEIDSIIRQYNLILNDYDEEKMRNTKYQTQSFEIDF